MKGEALKTVRKSVLGFLFVLALVLGLTAGTSGRAVAAGNGVYPLWVGGTQVTDANRNNVLGDGKVRFTPSTGSTPATLRLALMLLGVAGIAMAGTVALKKKK